MCSCIARKKKIFCRVSGKISTSREFVFFSSFLFLNLACSVGLEQCVSTVAPYRGSKMGKYMRKGKGVGEVAVMEVSQGSLGVRTRARTLAAASSQKDHRRLGASKSVTTKHQSSAPPASPCVESSMHTCYLELRSRKLEKFSRCYHSAHGATSHGESKRSLSLSEPSRLAVSEEARVASDKSSHRVLQQQSSVAHSRNNSATFSHNAKPAKAAQRKERRDDDHTSARPSEAPHEDEDGMEVEASFGENVMDLDSRERRTRETTPSSYTRDVETMETPGSTTRPPSNAGRRRFQTEGGHGTRNQFHVPTTNEIEEFFAGAEQQEQRRFTDRYNYDPVSDSPLPGRFEWVRLRP